MAALRQSRRVPASAVHDTLAAANPICTVDKGDVASGPAVDGVAVSVDADETIVARSAGQTILADASVDAVVAGASHEPVVAASALQDIVPRPGV